MDKVVSFQTNALAVVFRGHRTIELHRFPDAGAPDACDSDLAGNAACCGRGRCGFIQRTGRLAKMDRDFRRVPRRSDYPPTGTRGLYPAQYLVSDRNDRICGAISCAYSSRQSKLDWPILND